MLRWSGSLRLVRELPPVCILAGGRGTRLGERARGLPKALIDVNGEPFVFHQLRLLARHGAHRVVLCVGYLGQEIIERVGRERFGISITYSQDGPQPLGTLGALRKAVPLLGERFLVLYGDTYLRLDYKSAVSAWERSTLPAMMTVLHNEDRWDTSNAIFDGERVIAYDKRMPSAAMKWIDYGLGALDSGALETLPADVSDLADLYRALAERKELFGYAVTERFYEIGTPPALSETTAFLVGESRAAGMRPATT